MTISQGFQSFAGQHFIVTGSTRGLGAAVAHLLAERGAAGLVICGRNQAKGLHQVEQLAALGCEALFVPTDLTQEQDLKQLVDAGVDRFGTLHGLVNCAGMSDRGGILDTSSKLFDDIFATNVKAPFFLMQHLIKHMIQHQIEGRIVNIVTMTSHGGQSFLTPYAASKGALATLTKNVAFSAMRNRIRVNGLNIGWMDTPHEHEIQQRYHQADENWLEKAEAGQPFGRLLKPAEVAQSVAFLLSEESGMMTGALIDLDQGIIGCDDQGTPKPLHALTLPVG